MKKSKEKIGVRTEKMGEEKVARKNVQKVITVLLILSLAACEKAWYGSDGLPGDSYVSLTWQIVEPTYIDAGTHAIPPRFYWGDNYLIKPGFYNLYYEGSVWTGQSWANYAWEVTYEIYEVPGERGDWYYHGANGPDNYFILECSPYGPYIGSNYKSNETNGAYEVLKENDKEIVVRQKADGISMKVNYKKVEMRN